MYHYSIRVAKIFLHTQIIFCYTWLFIYLIKFHNKQMVIHLIKKIILSLQKNGLKDNLYYVCSMLKA
jgi:hypothetical protein